MKVDPNNFDYVMYVDASGDDGFKFDGGSSICYAASALLVNRADIAHNLDILNLMKGILGCKQTDEIKYSKIRRHRRGNEALSLLRGIKGKMSCYVVFKKELNEGERNENGSKDLSVVCHLMAIRSLDYFSFCDEDNVLVVIDRMKHTEEAPLERQMNHGVLSTQEHPERKFRTETIFRDSKDINFLLLQISDLLCGTIREHFEQYEANREMLYFSKRCPHCHHLRYIKKAKTRNLCKNGKSLRRNIIDSKNLKNIFHLFPAPTTASMLDFFFMRPTKMIDSHLYMICKKA